MWCHLHMLKFKASTLPVLPLSVTHVANIFIQEVHDNWRPALALQMIEVWCICVVVPGGQPSVVLLIITSLRAADRTSRSPTGRWPTLPLDRSTVFQISFCMPFLGNFPLRGRRHFKSRYTIHFPQTAPCHCQPQVASLEVHSDSIAKDVCRHKKV